MANRAQIAQKVDPFLSGYGGPPIEKCAKPALTLNCSKIEHESFFYFTAGSTKKANLSSFCKFVILQFSQVKDTKWTFRPFEASLQDISS
jgi:hypothetical protein